MLVLVTAGTCNSTLQELACRGSRTGKGVWPSRDELVSSARLLLGLGHLCLPAALKGTPLGLWRRPSCFSLVYNVRAPQYA